MSVAKATAAALEKWLKSICKYKKERAGRPWVQCLQCISGATVSVGQSKEKPTNYQSDFAPVV